VKSFFGRMAAAVPATVALLALMAVPALAAEKGKVGDESMELRESLASFFGPRSAPATTVNPQAFVAAASTSDDIPSIDSTPWQELGPYSYYPDDRRYIDPCCSNSGSGSGFNTGRITGVAVAPNGDVYAAGAGGGVWRSTDADHQAWTPVFDTQQTTAEGALTVVSAGDGNPADYTVYAGTGEPTINLDSYAGVGILASNDHGASWHRVGGNELVGAAVFKIVQADDGVLYAATSHGLYRLAPGDAAWHAVIGGTDTNPGTPNAQVLNLVSDVAVRPGTGGQEVVAVRGWRAGASTNGLYVSHDHGRTFTGPLQPQGYVPANAQGRGSLAYSANGTKLYVMVENPVSFARNGGGTMLAGIYLSTHDVQGPFTQIASPSVLMNSGSAQKPGAIGTGYKPGVQAWYNQFITVDPASADHVYVGLEEVYETTDAGKSWVTAAPYWDLTLKCFDLMALNFGGCPNTTHSDQHAAAIAGGTLWVGNDGGVFSRPTNVSTAGGGWTDHNQNLGTLQYYYADSGTDPRTGQTVIWGGLQDNGTSKLIEGPDKLHPQEASQPFGGDGGDTIVDTTNADNVLTEYVSLTPEHSNDGGQHWTDATPGDPNPLFIAPYVQDDAVASDLYAGGEFLWKSTNGFQTVTTDWAKLFDTGAGHSISALDVASGQGYAAWCGPCWPGYVSEAGFHRGLITNLGTGSWHQLDLSAVPSGCDAVPNRYITGIAIDPADPRHAYLSLSGYARHWMVGPDDPGVGHVFETGDGGTCWHDISGDLVDAPANDVAIVGSRLVVADDVGVFASGLGGGSWLKVGVGLPHTIVADLNTTPDGRLLAATHGRGLWAIPTSALG
jgi:photosystem II stability/assembly factor-like uncharacterized protein